MRLELTTKLPEIFTSSATGGSFSPDTFIFLDCVLLRSSPSETVKVAVLVMVEGSSLVF